jgi:hypothetical protein|tara:strand:- start:432 stop:629 length:198 start_codon:yes stop_codon:yes gene_type:complete
MEVSKNKTLLRREFLKAAGTTGAVAGVAAVTLSGKSAKAGIPKASDQAGYKETEHVKTYYDLARF